MNTLPERPIVIGCDVDNTLVPTNDQSPEARHEGFQALRALCTVLQTQRQRTARRLYFGSVTGRTLASHDAYEVEHTAFYDAVRMMDFKILSVGTEVHYRNGEAFLHDTAWPTVHKWDAAQIRAHMQQSPAFAMQPLDAQTTHKISYQSAAMPDQQGVAFAEQLGRDLLGSGIETNVIFSGGQYLDIVPYGVDKGSALRYAATAVSGSPAPFIVAAGDSLNDCAMLERADLAVIPANAHDSLLTWAARSIDPAKMYHATQPFAGGVLEALQAHDILS